MEKFYDDLIIIKLYKYLRHNEASAMIMPEWSE
jgi:hypothetical protein